MTCFTEANQHFCNKFKSLKNIWIHNEVLRIGNMTPEIKSLTINVI